MKAGRTFFGWMALSVMALGTARLAMADTAVKDAEGKTVLVVQKDDIKSADGSKRLAVVDGDSVKTEDGKLILFFAGDMVRNKPEGDLLLYIDGRHIKRAPGGAELLYVDGKNILQPDRAGKKIYRFDGDEVTKQRRFAALYLLMPDLFKTGK